MATSSDAKTPLLVPVDFSDHSVEALAFAADLSTLMERQLIVLHVVHDPASAPGYYRKNTAEDDDRTMDALAEEMMAKFLEKTKKNNPSLDISNIKTRLLDGSPSRRIVEYAILKKAYMIIMGSHGHRGVKALLIASKAKKVMKYAPMPVTIVKTKEARAYIKENGTPS